MSSCSCIALSITTPKPLLSKLSVTLSAAARLIEPTVAVIVPLLTTLPPRSVTPPAAAVIAPPLDISATVLPPASITSTPLMKLEDDWFSVLATRPPTLICAVLPKIMPLVFTKNTWPLEFSRPKIWVGFPPTTRLRTTDDVPGWLKVTVAAEPMSKLDQFNAMRAEVWSIVRDAPLGALIVPVPPAMLPPVGNWVEATWAFA